MKRIPFSGRAMINGLHQYLTMTNDQQIRVTGALVQLASELPHSLEQHE